MADFPAAPLILDRKTLGHVHVVLGNLQSHIAFVSEVIGGGGYVPQVPLDHLTDAPLLEALQGDTPVLFTVQRETGISIAQDTRAKVGVWVAAPLKRRSAAVRVLVRRGVSLTRSSAMEDDQVDTIGDMILDNLGDDAMPQAVIWEAAWMASGPNPGVKKRWLEPWEDPWKWARTEVPLSVRMHLLYRDLVGWVFMKDRDPKKAVALGLSVRRCEALQALRLNTYCVERTITLLSKWRTQPDPTKALQVALQIGSVWQAARG